MKVLLNNGEVVACPEDEELEVIRHSCAHLLAAAVKRLYPNAMFGYGPATEHGFYYDIDFGDEKVSEENFAAIEAEMKAIQKENPNTEVFELPRAEAIALMEERGEKYKVEHIADLPEDAHITFFRMGEYVDMCRGPHMLYIKGIKAFELNKVSGAYWKADASNNMLTRISGLCFKTKADLAEFKKFMEEAEKRDHRKIGREMDLFMMSDAGPGFPFFLPNGMILRNQLMDFARELNEEYGYNEIMTPIILNRQLWLTSGHWDHYKDNMYFTEIDEEPYAVKPMNCPGGVLVYKNRKHSYRELPLRIAEFGLVHRHEFKGALHGLFRVRNFTQDDAHIWITPDQITQEVTGCISLITKIYEQFGFEYHIELSTRPEDSMGTDEEWDAAIAGLKGALESLDIDYVINEGDGAFYGPKIDFHLTDSIGRTWQCGTIQLDFQMPQNFDATYTAADNTEKRPIMIHRAGFGSIERFIGMLIEHYAGNFPTWIAPIQVKVLPVSEKSMDYAREVTEKFKAAGIRVVLDERDEKVGYKIREARAVDRVPYMLVLGEKEAEEGNISVRNRANKTYAANTDEFIASVVEEIATRA